MKVTDPSKPDQRKFGDVRGLTGGLIDSLLEGAELLGELAPVDVRPRTAQVWKLWQWICQFIETQSVPTQTFSATLKQWGELLLDTFEWKV